MKDTKAEKITTLDLSGITITNNEVTGFEACTQLVEVKLPNDAEAIGDNAFKGCTALTTVIQNENTTSQTRTSMPSRVKSVGASAFEDCTSMTEMFLHAGITKVGNNVFKGCTAMTALVFESTKEVSTITLGNDIIAGTHADLKIFLPAINDATVAASYKTALNNKPTYCNFAGYGAATPEAKVNTDSYTLLPSGSTAPGFEPGGSWGN